MLSAMSVKGHLKHWGELLVHFGQYCLDAIDWKKQPEKVVVMIILLLSKYCFGPIFEVF